MTELIWSSSETCVLFNHFVIKNLFSIFGFVIAPISNIYDKCHPINFEVVIL